MSRSTVIIFIILSFISGISLYAQEKSLESQNKDNHSRVEVKGALHMQASLDNSHIIKDGEGHIYLEVKLQAGLSKKQDRPPLSIAIVLDRSGSMSGQKLVDAKAAAIYLVENLNDNDKVTVITYGSDVTVVQEIITVSDKNREKIITLIRNIRDQGNTNLSGGLEAGQKQLLAGLSARGVNRILLLSDGLANRGITDLAGLRSLSSEIQKQQITITTMGVGVDYDEDLMTAVAQTGGGNYYFIQASNQLQEMFNKEFEGMAGTIAIETNLVMTLPDGAKVEEVYGYPHQDHGNTAIVPLHSFWAKQEKSLLVKLKVPTLALGEQDVVKLKLTYHNVEDNKGSSSETAFLRIICTDQEPDVTGGMDTTVVERVQEIEIARTNEEAMKLYKKGEVEKAKETIKRQRVKTKSVNKAVKSEKLDEEMGEMESLMDDMDNIAPESDQGKAKIKSTKKKSYEQQRKKDY